MLKTILGVLVSLVVLALPARAETLVLVGDHDWAPLSSPQAPQQGLANAITRQAFARVGIDVEILLMP